MILVTGAAGKTGLAILEKLAHTEPVKGGEVAIRGMVRRPEQRAQVEGMPAAEVVVGDLRNPSDLRRAMDGAKTVYHICPNMQPDEVAIGEAVIAAAKDSGVERIVYHSVLHPQTQEMLHHWHKLLVEGALFKSGLAYTILQPAAYMQNVLAGWADITAQGIFQVPYHPETVLGMVDLADVAEVAAKVLTEPDHEGAIYELATNERLTQVQCAKIMAQGLGRPVEVSELDRDAWRAGATEAGLSTFAADTLVAMFLYYEQFGFFGNGTVMTALLGRAPTSFDQFIAGIT